MSFSRHFAVSLTAVFTTLEPALPRALAHFASVFVVSAQPCVATSVNAAAVISPDAIFNRLDLAIDKLPAKL
jgi:hypothetical protein